MNLYLKWSRATAYSECAWCMQLVLAHRHKTHIHARTSTDRCLYFFSRPTVNGTHARGKQDRTPPCINWVRKMTFSEQWPAGEMEEEKYGEKEMGADVLIGAEDEGSKGGSCMVSLCCIDGE